MIRIRTTINTENLEISLFLAPPLDIDNRKRLLALKGSENMLGYLKSLCPSPHRPIQIRFHIAEFRIDYMLAYTIHP
jgi:hypothetical protein